MHLKKVFKLFSDEASADHEEAQTVMDEIGKIITNGNLTVEQVYYAAEISEFWCYWLSKPLAIDANIHILESKKAKILNT